MALTFLKGRQLGKRPKNASSRADPISAAKTKILDAIDTQRNYAKLLIDGKPLPTREGGRSHTTWFYRESGDVWWTSIRYGQSVHPTGRRERCRSGGQAGGTTGLHNTVIMAIKLQQTRSAAIVGNKGKRKTA